MGDALLTRLELDLGVGDATITLPRELTPEGSLPVSISAGVGNLTLRVHRTAPVRLKIESGLGNIDVSGHLERDGSFYLSTSYLVGAPAFKVNIEGGIGRVSIMTY